MAPTHSLFFNGLACSLVVMAGFLPTQSANAQASFHEGFDGNSLSQLESEGWIFSNQSVPLGELGWRPANVTDPQAGTHYLVTDGYCVGYDPHPNPIGSNWAVLPAVPGQVAGDDIRFYLAEGWTALRNDVMQLRYSPGGGADTGSGPEDVGDFTVLLAEYPHDTIGWWNERIVPLPGDGRVAFRFYTPTGRAAGMYLDSLTVGTAPAGPIPMPQAGETVHWDATLGSVVFDAGIDIVPAGGVVVVDPGVTVSIQSDSMLQVYGAIEFGPGSTLNIEQGSSLRVDGGGNATFSGAPGNRITVHGSQAFNTPGIEVFFSSSLVMDQVDLDVFTWVSAGAVAVVNNATFTRTSNSSFDLPGFRVFNASLAIRNSNLTDSRILNEEGYLLLDNLSFNNSQLFDQRFRSPHTLYLNNIIATNNVDGAPFRIDGFDVLLGQQNIISNNLFPVRLEGGGLAPGSYIPASGNLNNYVSGIARFGRRATWANVGVPYVLDWDNNIPAGSGRLTVEPGVVAQFRRGVNTTSDPFPIEFYADLVSRGTPEQPITFQAFDPVAGWGGLFYGDNSSKRPKLEHTIIEHADTAVISTANRVRLNSALLRDNGRGAQSNSSGLIIARGTQFLNNGVGVETSPGSGTVGINAGQADLRGAKGVNSFAGNGVGLTIQNPSITQVDASNNWWGDITGPTHPGNPGGSGDSASEFATVLPFASAPAPGIAPMVDLLPVSSVLEAGTRVMLRWTLTDGGNIVSQRLEYSPHGENPGLSTLIDNIAPQVRSLEVVVPANEPSSNIQSPVFRLIAADDTGREGWDEAIVFTPFVGDPQEFTVDPMPALMRPGETAPVCWSEPYADAYLDISDRNYAISLGGTTTQCLSGDLKAPAVSTDQARIIVVRNEGAGGRVRYEYSGFFSIRPDPLLGDAPPQVTLLAPLAGEQFAGGEIVPVAWTASDDEAIRSIDLQASYDGGRNWNEVASGLPGTSNNFEWALPSSAGIDDVRLRVVARDLRFQASSDGAGRVFSITPGQACVSRCAGDADNDGIHDEQDNCTLIANPNQVDTDGDGYGNSCDPDIAQPGDCATNFQDLAVMKLAFFTQPGDLKWNADADLNADGAVNLLDLAIMKAMFFNRPGPSGLTTVCNGSPP